MATAVRTVVTAGIGTMIEGYDLLIYGYLAGVLAGQFFPAGDPTAALLNTFAILAVGFLARPIVTVALLGGTAPYVSTWLVARTGSAVAPAWYLAVMAYLALITAVVGVRSTTSQYPDPYGHGHTTDTRREDWVPPNGGNEPCSPK